MNQARTFLLAAWLAVATLLWMAWNKDHEAVVSPAAETTTQPITTSGASVPSLPSSSSSIVSPASVSTPASPVAPAAMASMSAVDAASGPLITVTTDVLKVTLDGGAIHTADILRYPQTTQSGSEPVRLFADDASHFFEAQSGWVSSSGAAPTHAAGFLPASDARTFTLAPGAGSLQVPFVWQGPNGVNIRRLYTFTRGDYVVGVRDDVVNQGAAPWQGFVYRQLVRVPPQIASGMMHPESYSFQGAAWFSASNFEKRKFAKFSDGPQLNTSVTGGWIGMLQHHFFTAWIPGAKDASTFSTAIPQPGQTLIREVGPGVNVAPGASASTSARLWVGPKLVEQIEAQHVSGLERAVDFSSFSLMAVLAGWLFWVLQQIHQLLGNWGWSIIGLVVVLKLAMYPLSAAQYKSMAKMRRFQPRIEQLKERYGEDKQKFQMALMELYKKEKINPVGGCFPVLLQMPIFLALYWMLSESVELRHAPWIGWIHDLTARDPLFILPAINVAVMFATQKLAPKTPGMDPTQQKMMQYMPLVFGVMFGFMPAGLVLYWITNGSLGLLQQWWNTRLYGGQTLPKKT
ncbi:MAG: membrane protein insertase YidC [Luteimonas sp.]